MIWALLLALILGSSNTNPFVTSKVPKLVKMNIDDKETKSEAMTMVKAVKKDFKSFQKQNKKLIKQFKQLNSDYHSKKAEMKSVMDQSIQLRKAYQDRTNLSRHEFTGFFNDASWESLINDIHAQTGKKEKKMEKSAEKALQKVQVLLADVRDKMNGIPLEPEAKAQLTSSYDLFSSNILELIAENSNMYGNITGTMENRQSTVEELENMYSDLNSVRYELFESYLTFRYGIPRFLSENEWKVVNKQVNKLLKRLN